MAKLRRLPSRETISGFRGKVDFYLWDLIPVARKWPRKPDRARSPAVQAQWPAFAYAAHAWKYLPPEIQSAYNSMAQRSGLSGRDLQERAYLKGLFTYPTGE